MTRTIHLLQISIRGFSILINKRLQSLQRAVADRLIPGAEYESDTFITRDANAPHSNVRVTDRIMNYRGEICFLYDIPPLGCVSFVQARCILVMNWVTLSLVRNHWHCLIIMLIDMAT